MDEFGVKIHKTVQGDTTLQQTITKSWSKNQVKDQIMAI